MTQSTGTTGMVVDLRPATARAPYFAWLDLRFPSGEIDYQPPVDEFLASTEMRNAWVSHVPDGGAPQALRMDLYLRRGWRTDTGALCLANCGPAGEEAPATAWTAPTLALLSEAIADLETKARAAGFARIAVERPSEDVRMACADAGYTPYARDDEDLVKIL